MKKPGITVVVPSIPERSEMLGKAVASAALQTLQPRSIYVMMDDRFEGASVTRTRGLMAVETEWTAFLDDDDQFLPFHLEHLMHYAEKTNSDLVFPWFTVVGGIDPFPMNEHREFDVEDPHQTTVTFLVKTELAQACQGFSWDPGLDQIDPGTDEEGNRAGEEFRFVIRMARAGHKIGHLDERTWLWYHHGRNTMGLPSRRRL